MPSKQFELEPDGPKRLEVRWEGSAFDRSWRNLVVTLDGRPMGTIPNGSALTAGQTMTSPDGSVFLVRSARGLAAMTLYIERNGAPLPGVSAAPIGKSAPWVFASLALLAAIEGLVAHFGILDFHVPGFIFGELAILLLLPFFASRRSPRSVLVCVAFYVGVAVVARLTGAAPVPSPQGIALRVMTVLGFTFLAVKSLRAPRGGAIG